MPNTVTQKTMEGSGDQTYISRVIHLESDGTEETDLVIFDNSAFINDASKGRLVCLEANGDSCTIILEWDQTTDSEVIRFNPIYGFKYNFTKLGGGGNPNGAGATGDLLLSTSGLDSGDAFTLKIVVQQV